MMTKQKRKKIEHGALTIECSIMRQLKPEQRDVEDAEIVDSKRVLRAFASSMTTHVGRHGWVGINLAAVVSQGVDIGV